MEVVGYETRKARTSHRCTLCGGRIRPGQRYDRWVSIDGGDIQECKVHEHCRQVVRDHCDYYRELEWTSDEVMEYIREYLDSKGAWYPKTETYEERVERYCKHKGITI